MLKDCLRRVKKSNNSAIKTGLVKDIDSNIQKPMTVVDQAFLIITVSESGGFIHFNGDTGKVQIDFPMVTGRQKNVKPFFRKTTTVSVKTFDAILQRRA